MSQKKEIFGIIGKSGAGKTTLSRIISGIIEPTSGEMNILIGDDWVDMTKPGIDQRGRAKEYIGLLHQEYDLFPHRTVLDNLTDSIGLEFPKELAIRKAVITLRMAGFTEEKSQADPEPVSRANSPTASGTGSHLHRCSSGSRAS